MHYWSFDNISHKDCTVYLYVAVHGVCLLGLESVPISRAGFPTRRGFHGPQRRQHGPSI